MINYSIPNNAPQNFDPKQRSTLQGNQSFKSLFYLLLIK